VSIRQRWPQIALGLMMALYLAYFGWFTLRAYDAFVYQAYDLGIYDQAVWNTAHGHPFRSTLEEPYDILLGDHFEPILLPMALIYLVWDSPKALLFVQAAGLALGALPTYWLARDTLRSALTGGQLAGKLVAEPDRSPAPLPVELLALLFAGVYLLYPPVHSANVFEFHPSALAIPFLLFAVYFLRRRRLILYFVFVALTMSTKEVMPLTTLALGLYAFLIERERAVGLWTMFASLLWFGLVVFVIIPHFSPENQSQYFGRFYGWLGESASKILSRLITHPELLWQRLTRQDSLRYMSALLRPTAYLALFGMPVLLGALPALFLNVLSDWSFQHDPLYFYQYAAGIAPFVIVAAIDGIAFLARRLGSVLQRTGPVKGWSKDVRFRVAAILIGLMVVASLAVQRYHGYLPFSQDYYLAPHNEKVAAARAIVQQVPPETTVSADLIFGPYVSHRQNLYIFPSSHDADYMIVDASYRDAPFTPRDRYGAIQTMLTNGQYGVADGRYGYLLLRRGLDQQVIPERFYGFARTAAPSPQIRTDIVFGDELRLIGFDMVWERPVRRRVNLVLYWQAPRPVDRDLRLFFIRTSPAGELLPGTEQEFDATVWYPPSRWSETEVIRTGTLGWSVEEPGRFGLAIGVVEGPGFWEVDKRLRPEVRSAPWSMPQLHDGSLVWLATLAMDGRIATLEKPGTE
jgi:uncharacterized membrane protein